MHGTTYLHFALVCGVSEPCLTNENNNNNPIAMFRLESKMVRHRHGSLRWLRCLQYATPLSAIRGETQFCISSTSGFLIKTRRGMHNKVPTYLIQYF